MQKVDETHYKVAPTERISMDVEVDQRPYLALFEDPPKGSKWENVRSTPTSEHREFVAPATFDASFDEALPAASDVDHVTYTVTFRGETGPSAGTSINVPRGGGPILITFVFQL
jgi:hypothetical protein